MVAEATGVFVWLSAMFGFSLKKFITAIAPKYFGDCTRGHVFAFLTHLEIPLVIYQIESSHHEV